jgi:YHS domain-containing protein
MIRMTRMSSPRLWLGSAAGLLLGAVAPWYWSSAIDLRAEEVASPFVLTADDTATEESGGWRSRRRLFGNRVDEETSAQMMLDPELHLEATPEPAPPEVDDLAEVSEEEQSSGGGRFFSRWLGQTEEEAAMTESRRQMRQQQKMARRNPYMYRMMMMQQQQIALDQAIRLKQEELAREQEALADQSYGDEEGLPWEGEDEAYLAEDTPVDAWWETGTAPNARPRLNAEVTEEATVTSEEPAATTEEPVFADAAPPLTDTVEPPAPLVELPDLSAIAPESTAEAELAPPPPSEEVLESAVVSEVPGLFEEPATTITEPVFPEAETIASAELEPVLPTTEAVPDELPEIPPAEKPFTAEIQTTRKPRPVEDWFITFPEDEPAESPPAAAVSDAEAQPVTTPAPQTTASDTGDSTFADSAESDGPATFVPPDPETFSNSVVTPAPVTTPMPETAPAAPVIADVPATEAESAPAEFPEVDTTAPPARTPSAAELFQADSQRTPTEEPAPAAATNAVTPSEPATQVAENPDPANTAVPLASPFSGQKLEETPIVTGEPLFPTEEPLSATTTEAQAEVDSEPALPTIPPPPADPVLSSEPIVEEPLFPTTPQVATGGEPVAAPPSDPIATAESDSPPWSEESASSAQPVTAPPAPAESVAEERARPRRQVARRGPAEFIPPEPEMFGQTFASPQDAGNYYIPESTVTGDSSPPPADLDADIPFAQAPAAPSLEPGGMPAPIVAPSTARRLEAPQPGPRSSTDVKLARIAERAGLSGLKGFCPVALRDSRELVDARAEYSAVFNGRRYYFSNQVAQAHFESAPDQYAPASSGNDVVHLSLTGEAAPGSLDHAVWFRGKLYLFSTAETLETFVAAPSIHAGAY